MGGKARKGADDAPDREPPPEAVGSTTSVLSTPPKRKGVVEAFFSGSPQKKKRLSFGGDFVATFDSEKSPVSVRRPPEKQVRVSCFVCMHCPALCDVARAAAESGSDVG